MKIIGEIDCNQCNANLDYVSNTGEKDYVWFEMGIFTHWESSNKCRVLCVDTPSGLPDQLETLLEKRPLGLNFGDPFSMHVDLIDLMIKYYDIAVWRIRDPVRRLEEVSMPTYFVTFTRRDRPPKWAN